MLKCGESWPACVHEPDSPFEATVGNALFRRCIVTLNFHDLTLDVQQDARGG